MHHRMIAIPCVFNQDDKFALDLADDNEHVEVMILIMGGLVGQVLIQARYENQSLKCVALCSLIELDT